MCTAKLRIFLGLSCLSGCNMQMTTGSRWCVRQPLAKTPGMPEGRLWPPHNLPRALIRVVKQTNFKRNYNTLGIFIAYYP